MQGMMSSLVTRRSGSSIPEFATTNASQNQQAPSHLVRLPLITDTTIEYLQLSRNPSSTSNTVAGFPSSESQDPEAVVPHSTQIPDAQTDGGMDSYGETAHTESQLHGQDRARNQPPSFEDIESICDICFGYLSNFVEGTWQDCPRCTSNNP
jgi:hypothetical protein